MNTAVVARPTPAPPVSSGAAVLADGRVHAWIDALPLPGVTPAMLHWWCARAARVRGTRGEAELLRLDEGGVTLRVRRLGLTLAVANWRFDAVDGGTRCRHTLTTGLAGAFARPANAWLRRFVFGVPQAHDWLRRRVDRARRLQDALPAQYRSDGGAAWTQVRRHARPAVLQHPPLPAAA